VLKLGNHAAALARLLLCCRNVYRGDAQMYALDDKALQWSGHVRVCGRVGMQLLALGAQAHLVTGTAAQHPLVFDRSCLLGASSVLLVPS
jgi:hypothetical protein